MFERKTDDVKIRELGSSLIITIPSKVIKEHGLKKGDILESWELGADSNTNEEMIAAKLKRYVEPTSAIDIANER